MRTHETNNINMKKKKKCTYLEGLVQIAAAFVVLDHLDEKTIR